MKSVLTKTDQRDFHGYCCYLQMEIVAYFFAKCLLISLQITFTQNAFRLEMERDTQILNVGMQGMAFLTTRYCCGQLFAAVSACRSRPKPNKMDEGRASNTKRNAKFTRKLIYKGRNLHQGAIKRLIC